MRQLHTLLFFYAPFLAIATPLYYLEEVSSVIPFEVRNKLILVEGQVDGRSGYFLFDTGAPELILNEAYFPRREYHGLHSYLVDISGRRAFCGYAYISSFNWGGLRRNEFFAPRIALARLERILGEEVLGIIGYEVLKHVDLEVEYNRRSITLLQPGSRPLGSRPDYTFDFDMNHHLPVVKARLGDIDGLLMAIDSGSSVNICTRRLKRKLKNKALQKRAIGLQGASGNIKRSPYYVMESLQVEGTYSIAYCRVALGNMDALEGPGFQVDGVLGVNFFRLGRVYFSYRSRRIAVWLKHNDYTMRHSSLRPAEGLSAE